MATNPGTKFEKWIRNELRQLYEDAKRRKASGALHGDGDITAGPFEFEAKDNPDQKSISITQKDWQRTVSAARKAGSKIPIFVNKNANGVFVTMQWDRWFHLLEQIFEGETDEP